MLYVIGISNHKIYYTKMVHLNWESGLFFQDHLNNHEVIKDQKQLHSIFSDSVIKYRWK